RSGIVARIEDARGQPMDFAVAKPGALAAGEDAGLLVDECDELFEVEISGADSVAHLKITDRAHGARFAVTPLEERAHLFDESSLKEAAGAPEQARVVILPGPVDSDEERAVALGAEAVCLL